MYKSVLVLVLMNMYSAPCLLVSMFGLRKVNIKIPQSTSSGISNTSHTSLLDGPVNIKLNLLRYDFLLFNYLSI